MTTLWIVTFVTKPKGRERKKWRSGYIVQATDAAEAERLAREEAGSLIEPLESAQTEPADTQVLRYFAYRF